MNIISSIDALLTELGGNAGACSIAGLESTSAPSNWKARGFVPPEYFLVFSEAVRPKEIDPALFGFKQPADVRS